MNYRTHITIRRQGVAPFNGFEQQTETHGSTIEEIKQSMKDEYGEWIEENITADTILLEEEGEDENN